MDFSNPLLALFVGLMCFLLAGSIATGSRFYRTVLAGMEHGRTRMIDGLRGWLALGVLLTHAGNMHAYFSGGTWVSPHAGVYGRLGPVGVCLFFMVTAFLFWGRVIRTDGRLDVAQFFISRVRRLVPMYLVSVVVVLGVVALLSGLALHVSLYTLVKEARPWFAFGFMSYGDINGVTGAHYIDAAYWTLAYEWLFYLALPLLALCHRGWKFGVLLALAALYLFSASVALCFIFGALAAWLVERKLLPSALQSLWLAPLPLAGVALALTYPDTYGFVPELLLFIFFLFIVGDNSLFGFLATRAAKLLGTVSYSLYLLHCIVLFVAVWVANSLWPIQSMPMQVYGSLVVCVALVTVLLSVVTYRHIEHPFLVKRVGPAAGDAPLPRAPFATT